ncbi:MAG: oligopeptide transporter, OPT family [Verrucomicrobia bacterium]|nr:oligopeptide transporter, OPT family [Verrucomicrobiota bacterium]
MIEHGKPIPELTIKSVLLGMVLSMVLASAMAYLGLFAGMTISASIPAAVVSMGILRLFRRHSIYENNIVQTAASAGEALAAGVIFTLPAMVIMGSWEDFNYLWVTVIAGFGGLLGVLFTIPLRRALIIESDLKFPEGIATAEVLRSGQRGGTEIKHIVKSAMAGALYKLGSSGFRIWPEVAETAGRAGNSIVYFGSNLSPALLAVGYIVGLNVAILMFAGGIVNWLVAIPACAISQPWPVVDGEPMAAMDYAWTLWSTKTRYLGVGGMLVGGLWTIIKMRHSLFSGIRSGLKAYQNLGPGQTIDRTEKDIPMKWVLVLIIASVVPLFLLYQTFVDHVAVALPMAITMLVTGFLFSAVAGYMAGLVGSSNNPISGITIATVTISALLLLLLMGKDAENGPPAAIIIGAVVCCAAAIAGDNMQDLKAGHLIKATPWKQQLMQMVGTLSAALVLAPVLMLLLNAYGFAGHESAKANPLIAAQANLMAAVAKGVFEGGLPWNFVGMGALFASGVILLDESLARRGSRFRTPVLAVTIGIYLPFELEVPIFIGGLLSIAIKRMQQKRQLPAKAIESANRGGLLFASGLITGEALAGILLAIPIVASGNPDILALVKEPSTVGLLGGIILLGIVAAWLCKVAINPGKNTETR